MSSAPKAFLLHGFLGSGKTTLAKRLEQQQGAVRFTHDEWMSRLYGEDPPAALFDDYASRISAVMETMWTRCLDLGTPVILDFGFWSRAERLRVRSLILEHGGDPVLYSLTCPEHLAWQRIEQRNARLAGSLYITPTTFGLLKTRFEPLGPDEMHIRINSCEPD